MTETEGIEKTRYKANYIFVIPGNNFSLNFITTWSNTVVYLLEKNKSFFYKFGYSPVISSIRNQLIAEFPNFEQPLDKKTMKKVSEQLQPIMPFDGQIVTDKVIFIDSDIIWTNEALQMLLDSPYDVTVAPYVLSDRQTTSVRKDGKFILIDEYKDYNEPFQIEAAGLGFMACKFEVLQNMSYPWFSVIEEIIEENGKLKGDTVGEDAYFFFKLADMGYKAYCDPRIKVGHEKVTTLTI
jgi:hypothetical protein